MKASQQRRAKGKGKMGLLDWARRSPAAVAAAAILGITATVSAGWIFRDQFAKVEQSIQLAEEAQEPLPDLFEGQVVPGCLHGSTCDGEFHIPQWSNPDQGDGPTVDDGPSPHACLYQEAEKEAEGDRREAEADDRLLSYEEWLQNPVYSDIYGDYMAMAYHLDLLRDESFDGQGETQWEECQRKTQEMENFYAQQAQDDPSPCEVPTGDLMCIFCGYGTLPHQTHCPVCNGPIGTPEERENYLTYQREREKAGFLTMESMEREQDKAQGEDEKDFQPEDMPPWLCQICGSPFEPQERRRVVVMCDRCNTTQ